MSTVKCWCVKCGACGDELVLQNYEPVLVEIIQEALADHQDDCSATFAQSYTVETREEEV